MNIKDMTTLMSKKAYSYPSNKDLTKQVYNVLQEADEKDEKKEEYKKPSIFAPALLAGGGLASALLANYAMNQEDYRKYQSFASIDSTMNNKADEIDFIKSYASRGSEALNAKLFGMEPLDLVQSVRRGTGPGTILGAVARHQLSGADANNPLGIGYPEHYQEFKKGQRSGVAVRVNELTKARLGDDGYNQANFKEIRDQTKRMTGKDITDVSTGTLMAAAGRGSKEGYDKYKKVVNGVLTARNIALYGGAAAAGIGGGLLLANLIKRYKEAEAKKKKKKELRAIARKLVDNMHNPILANA